MLPAAPAGGSMKLRSNLFAVVPTSLRGTNGFQFQSFFAGSSSCPWGLSTVLHEFLLAVVSVSRPPLPSARSVRPSVPSPRSGPGRASLAPRPPLALGAGASNAKLPIYIVAQDSFYCDRPWLQVGSCLFVLWCKLFVLSRFRGCPGV